MSSTHATYLLSLYSAGNSISAEYFTIREKYKLYIYVSTHIFQRICMPNKPTDRLKFQLSIIGSNKREPAWPPDEVLVLVSSHCQSLVRPIQKTGTAITENWYGYYRTRVRPLQKTHASMLWTTRGYIDRHLLCVPVQCLRKEFSSFKICIQNLLFIIK